MKSHSHSLAVAILATALVSAPLHAAKPGTSNPPGGTNGSWGLSGNAGTNPTTQFLGTTDNQPLELRQNNQRVLRFQPGDTLYSHAINVIAGSPTNQVTPETSGATIAGGGAGTVVPGGAVNANRVESDFGTVGGGLSNVVYGQSLAAVIAGGFRNEAINADYGSILGGSENKVSGRHATIGGGQGNVASGARSFAAGYKASAEHEGSFVWADSSPENRDAEGRFRSYLPNQFRILASGGVSLSSKTTLDFDGGARQFINFDSSRYGIGQQLNMYYFRSAHAFAWYRGGVHSKHFQDPGFGGMTLMVLKPSGLTVNGTFVSSSDREKKENFTSIDSAEVLAKVVALPISCWSYKDDEQKSVHVGPMAQDFYAAFNLGADDKHIATVDADGVALAAIQGLYAKVQQENAELTTRLAKLEAMLQQLQSAR
jgi:trimeric autotransporter adhesin